MNEDVATPLSQRNESQYLEKSSDSEEVEESSKKLLAIMKENSEKLKLILALLLPQYEKNVREMNHIKGKL